MGPFPTCKGPEGDKLQGTIIHHFFVSILVLIIQNLKKSLEPFLPKLRKSAILAQIFPFWAENGGGRLFFKNLFRSLFYISAFPTCLQRFKKSLEQFPGKVLYGWMGKRNFPTHSLHPFHSNWLYQSPWTNYPLVKACPEPKNKNNGQITWKYNYYFF